MGIEEKIGYDDGEVSPLSGCQRCSPDDAQDSWSSVPDATACTSLDGCVQNAYCTAGMCIGEMVDCDDSDPCTTDSCGDAGCIHIAAEPGTSCEPCECGRRSGAAMSLPKAKQAIARGHRVAKLT